MAEKSISSFALLFTRLFWMIFGPLALFLLVSTIARSGGERLPFIDVAFFAVIAGMISSRFYEFQAGDALTSRGEPMTGAVMARYALVVGLVGVAAWVCAKAFAHGGFGS